MLSLYSILSHWPWSISYVLPPVLFVLSPFPSNKLLSNTFSLCRRWSTSVIWTVTWCVFCWGGPSGMCALLTTSSGVSSTLWLYLKTQCPCIERTYWEIRSCWFVLSHSRFVCINWWNLIPYSSRLTCQHHECMIIFIHIKVMHM